MRTSLAWASLACAAALSCNRATEPEPASSNAAPSAGDEHVDTPIQTSGRRAPVLPPEPVTEAIEEPAAPTAAEPAPATPERADIYVNGAKLGEPDLRELEVRVDRRPEPGKYWYDAKSGLWGLIGHGASGLTAARLRAAPIAQDVASGTTGVVVNGRELNQTELSALTSLLAWPPSELSHYAGRYALDDRGGLYGPGNRYLGNLPALAAKSPALATVRCVWLHLGSERGPLGRGATVDCD